MTANILSLLQRRRLDELSVLKVLDSIRSIYGLVPLGGRVGGVGGVTPPVTPRNAALTLFWADQGTDSVEKEASDDQDEAKLWQFLLESVHLPSTGSETELRKALETIQKEANQDNNEEKTQLNVDTVRLTYFTARRVYFAVRMELFRAASNPHHPNALMALEVVEELLKEGLRDALLDELHGRQFVQPPRFQGVCQAERKALLAWEMQFMEEETLLRDLLLLTLQASSEKTTLHCAVKISKAVFHWETRVFPEIFTSSTLMQPVAQERARKLTQVGVLVVIRLLDTTSDDAQEEELRQATTDFFLTELSGPQTVEQVGPAVPSVLLLAWAALLGRQYRKLTDWNRDREKGKAIEEILKQTLAAAERLHSFHYLNLLLRSLVCQIDHVESESDYLRRKAMLQPPSVNATTLWKLPTVAATAGPNLTQSDQLTSYNKAFIYQLVAAEFLNNMLLSLGYLESLEDVQQLHAMVSFVLSALSSACVAQHVLGIDVGSNTMPFGIASATKLDTLHELLSKARAYLPHSLLPCMEMLTALSCNNHEASSPMVLRQVLKYLSMPRARLDDEGVTSAVYRPLPPREYYTEMEDQPDRIQCTQSFAYDDATERLVVSAGTIGTIVRSEDDTEQVEWRLISDNSGDALSLWDFLTLSADRFVAAVQSDSCPNLHRANSEDIKVLISFFEFIVQLGRQENEAHLVVEEMERRWGEARLRRWWITHQLPAPEIFLPLLVKQQIALPILLSASRENLVSWGIRDRCTREQIFVHLENQNVDNAKIGCEVDGLTSGMTAFGVDGGMHLLQLVLQVLEGFINTTHESKDDDAMDDDSKNRLALHLHVATAAFVALGTVLATTSGVDLLMKSFGSKQKECVSLIVKSSRKLFEMQERVTGEYVTVVATLDMFMSVVRWFFLKEAQSLTRPAVNQETVSCGGDRGFIANERLWFVHAVEFTIDVVSTYESWKFVTAIDQCEVAERCFRLLYVLVLPRKYIHDQNDMVPAFETALGQTLSTDMSMLMKVIRSSGALCSVESVPDYWKRIINDNGTDRKVTSDAETSDLSLLKVRSDSDRSGIDILRVESLVTTCLRFIALLLSNQDEQVAQNILLAPIDPKTSKRRTIVSLCWGYIGYSLEKAPAIAYWSLQILQRAAVVLDFRDENETQNVQSMGAPFYGHQNLGLVCGSFVQLLRRSPAQRFFAVQKEVITMLALCLDHQPSFVALVLFSENAPNAFKSENNSTNERSIPEEDVPPFVALLERFFEASERLLEQASDLFCTLLAFLVQVWKGALSTNRNIHRKIRAALEIRPSFWSNVTRALNIHMPLNSVDERGLLDTVLAAATAQGRGDWQNPAEIYLGRSSAYGYLARGLLLQFVSYEWHTNASKQTDHPLADVLDSFRKKGLYSHWLRTFTRLDYSPTQLRQYASYIQRVSKRSKPGTSLLREVSVSDMSMYLEGSLCNVSTLTWQLNAGGDSSNHLHISSPDVGVLKLIQWGNLQAAYLHAQLFSLSKWKVFMELCCLQTGEAGDNALEMDKSSEIMTSRPLKRKDSMISSPIRHSGSNYIQGLDATSGLKLRSSRFFGDLTSFGLIRVLTDVINTRVSQDSEVLDYFVLVHLHDLVELLVSMLHHQLCLVVRKTRDPKLSDTRQRFDAASDDANLKLDAEATQKLLAVVEQATAAVHTSRGHISREMDRSRPSQVVPNLSIECTSVPLIASLVTNFEERLESVIDRLYTLLFTAALLLVRHLSQLRGQLLHMTNRATALEKASPLLQVKFIGHCLQAMTLCDERKEPTKASQALFQMSWCLFQANFDSLNRVDASISGVSKLRMTSEIELHPFIDQLKLHQQGISALVHLLVQRFRVSSSSSKETAAKQEEACQILRGLVAIVWNSTTSDLCKRILLQETRRNVCPNSRLNVISMLGSQLLPLLQTQMEREEASSSLRGYTTTFSVNEEEIKMDQSEDDTEKLERSIAHRMWCLVLDFVAGLVRLEAAEPSRIESLEVGELWAFISRAESLFLAAVSPRTCRRLTYASIVEHQALLRFLNALSGNVSRRKRWRQAFPTNAVILMEHSRQMLRRVCVLLSSLSIETTSRLPKESILKPKNDSKVASKASFSCGSKSPRSPRSPSAFSYAHQTLMHDHLQAVVDIEKQQGAAFYREMEMELVDIVRVASLLLTKWTVSMTDRDVFLVIDGVGHVDDEQCVPLLDFTPPSEAHAMNGSPGLGHLILAMEFTFDQLEAEEEWQSQLKTTRTKLLLTNAFDACALLFLKTYRLYSAQYEVVKRDRDELKKYFRKLNARLADDSDNGSSAKVGVDVQLLQHIEKTLTG